MAFLRCDESTTNDRRGFFRKVAGLGLGLVSLSTGGCNAREGEKVPAARTRFRARKVPARVVEVRSDHCFTQGGQPVPDVLAAMLDTAMKTLFNVTSAASAWESVAAESDVVGLKVNCLAGPGLSSRPELAQVIGAALGAAGVSGNSVIAWDRQDEELLKAGYTLNDGTQGMRCFGTDHPGYGNDPNLVMNGRIGGFLSSILTRHTTATINVPVLKDHGIVGLSGSLKNNFGCIHNPNKYHPNCGDPYAADLNALPQIRDKQRLVVCDATTLQYQGGPGYKPRWAVPYGGILVATDPVAIDSVCCSMVEQWRKNNHLPSLAEVDRPAKHIQTAALPEYALGTADLTKIEFIRKTI